MANTPNLVFITEGDSGGGRRYQLWYDYANTEVSNYTASGMPSGTNFAWSYESTYPELFFENFQYNGSYPITVTVYDFSGGSASTTITVNITGGQTQPTPPPTWIDNSVSSSARVGQFYSDQVSANGATSYSLSGSLPPGLSHSGGSISGFPSSTGTYNFTISASNSGGTIQTSLSITVSNPPPTWSDNSISSTARIGTSYSDSVSASGTTSYSVSGSLPPGISFLNGSFSGTPTTAGSYSFTITASNSGGSINQSLSITVRPRLPLFTDSTISTSMRIGTPYSDSVTASNVSSYGVSSGSLPPGITLNPSTGSITGTPTTAGSYSFGLQAYNSSSEGASNGPLSFTINVLNLLPIWTDQVVSTTNFAVGREYSDAVLATNAVAYAVTSGSLPDGVSLNTSTGAISGIPTTIENYSFIIGARNSNNEFIYTTNFIVSVAAAGGKLRIYDGTNWVESAVYVYNGSSWVESPIYIYDGSSWIKSS